MLYYYCCCCGCEKDFCFCFFSQIRRVNVRCFLFYLISAEKDFRESFCAWREKNILWYKFYGKMEEIAREAREKSVGGVFLEEDIS